MSKKVQDILRHYKELDGEAGPIIADMKLDIQRALDSIEFTEDERNAIAALFLIDPLPPQRIIQNKRGGTSGRPRGTAARAYIEQLMQESNKSPNALNITVTRTVQSACAKIAEFLGEEYKDTEDEALYSVHA